jgi:hypothetical protein
MDGGGRSPECKEGQCAYVQERELEKERRNDGQESKCLRRDLEL